MNAYFSIFHRIRSTSMKMLVSSSGRVWAYGGAYRLKGMLIYISKKVHEVFEKNKLGSTYLRYMVSWIVCRTYSHFDSVSSHSEDETINFDKSQPVKNVKISSWKFWTYDLFSRSDDIVLDLWLNLDDDFYGSQVQIYGRLETTSKLNFRTVKLHINKIHCIACFSSKIEVNHL